MNKFNTLVTTILLGMSSVAFAKPAVISREFDANQITRVIVRSAYVTRGTVIKQAKSATVKISGTPSGGAKGYHPSDKKWKETPARDWGLSFESKTFGNTLVISSKNEIAFMHHWYWLLNIELEVPSGIQVVLSPRELNGDGKPDLSEPDF